MRREINNVISTIITFIKLTILKLLHGKNLQYFVIERFSPNVVIEINKGGKLYIGKKVRVYTGCKLKVCQGATLAIADNVRINYNCMIFCHESVTIGAGCEFGPNVLIYDHDHDYKCEKGIKSGKYVTAPVTIGENVWIGANTVILRGTTIGDNAVIEAGSIVKGNVAPGDVIIQKRSQGGKMIRVLQMIGSLNIGGSQTMVMNLYRSINRNRIQFDFIVDHPDHLFYADEIKKLGGRIYSMPTFVGTNVLQVKKAWNDFFREHGEYKILHSHVRSYASVYLPIAHKYGLKTIIHSHSTSNGNGVRSIVKKILQYPLRFQSDYYFGCSEIAGEWLFGKKIVHSDRYYMLKNAIDSSLYKTRTQIREAKREEINAGDKIIFGHVGRFNESKNHIFLLDIFAYIHERIPNTMLLLMGDGELRESIEMHIKELQLGDDVILLGMRSDVNEMLQAMDCFLFPSKWEGLPISVVEAQAAGLPCFVSDKVTREVGVSNLVTFLPINKGVEIWGREILDADLQRRDVTDEIAKAGFSIATSVGRLMEFYERLWNE